MNECSEVAGKLWGLVSGDGEKATICFVCMFN